MAAYTFAEWFKQNNKLSQMFWKQIPLLTQSNICASLFLAERMAQDQFLLSHNTLSQPCCLSTFPFLF